MKILQAMCYFISYFISSIMDLSKYFLSNLYVGIKINQFLDELTGCLIISNELQIFHIKLEIDKCEIF